MIQEPPPKLPEHFPKAWAKWATDLGEYIRRKIAFPADSSIIMEEKADGLSVRAQSETTTEIRPLELIEANNDDGPRVRVVKGGVVMGGQFWYPGTMDPIEDGTVEHPFTYMTALSSGDKIYLDGTVSLDGFFWRLDALDLAQGASVPANTATHIYQLLGVVSVADFKATVVRPQEFFGNMGIRREGVVSGFTVEPYIIR